MKARKLHWQRRCGVRRVTTAFRLDPRLVKQAREVAHGRNTSLGAIIESLLTRECREVNHAQV